MSGFSEKQKQILAFPFSGKEALICDGAIRSGKTAIMIISFVTWAMSNFNNQNFGICGKTVLSAERNIIAPFLKIKYFREQYRIKFSKDILTVSRGNKTNTFYVFGGKDESSYTLIQGITLAGVLLDEVALMPQSFVDQATARCSVEGSKFWFNCNPNGGPEHWFCKEWIGKPDKHNAQYLHFELDDNPSLSEAIKNRYKSQYTGVFYDRYIRGLWVVAEGRIYPNSDRFIMHDKLYGLDGQFYISLDYGTHNPFAMILWCINGNRAIAIKDFYFDSKSEGHQKTDEEYYKDLEDFAKGYYIREIIPDPSAASFIETVRRHGKFRVRPAENEVINGIRVTSSLLNAGMVRIHMNCVDVMREFGLYRWDEKQHNDAVIKENDHAMDAMRYFCSTILSRQFRWVPWEAK